MIGRLQGKLIEKQPPQLILDVNGVGYDVLAPMSTFYQLPELGAQAILHTHFAVSETAQQLYGFRSKDDRALFRQLIKVSGVGPKMALGIMSGMESDEFVRCVMDSNVAALVKVPGVGKKTAERLVIEMRDRLDDWNSAASGAAKVAGSVDGAAQELPASMSSISAEAESALIALGYKPVEAAKAVAGVLKNNEVTRSEELIRLALRSMLPK